MTALGDDVRTTTERFPRDLVRRMVNNYRGKTLDTFL